MLFEKWKTFVEVNRNNLILAMLGLTMLCSVVSASWTIYTEVRYRKFISNWNRGTEEFWDQLLEQ